MLSWFCNFYCVNVYLRARVNVFLVCVQILMTIVYEAAYSSWLALITALNHVTAEVRKDNGGGGGREGGEREEEKEAQREREREEERRRAGERECVCVRGIERELWWGVGERR